MQEIRGQEGQKEREKSISGALRNCGSYRHGDREKKHV
jgi:hypothetical protein